MQNENPLSKHLNKELKDIIGSVTVFQGTARESGAPYFAIDLHFINGFEKRLFLKQDELFAWVNAIECLELEKKTSDDLGF